MKDMAQQLIQLMEEGLELVATKKINELKGRNAIPSERKLQEGFYSQLVIRYETSRIVYFFDPLDWYDIPDYKIKLGANPYTKAETTEIILPALKSAMEQHFLNEKFSVLYEYKLDILLEIKCTDGILKDQFLLVNQKVKTKLKKSLDQFINNYLYGKFDKITFEKENYQFAQLLLDFDLHDYSVQKVKEVTDLVLNNVLQNFPQLKIEFIRSYLFRFKEWDEQVFKPLYFESNQKAWGITFELPENFNSTMVNKDLLDLYVYKNFLGVQYDTTPEFSLKELETASKYFHSKLASQYLKEGSGKFTSDEINYQDELIKCSANDVLAIFTIKI